MANNRANIRAALKTLLINANTSATSNVFANRENALWQAIELPAIIIYSHEESANLESLSTKRYIRTLTLLVTIKAVATSSVDDTLDALSAQVEAAIDSDLSLAGTVFSTILTKSEILVNAEGDIDVGVATLTYECKYIS